MTDNSLAAFDSSFAELTDLAIRTVAATSARVYMQTYRKWFDWCAEYGYDTMDWKPSIVLAFIDAGPTTKATRQRQLSAMRKLAQMRFTLDPDNHDARRIYEALKMVKPPQSSIVGKQHERKQKALTPAEADKMLRVWNDTTAQAVRNRALIAVLLLAGLRRSEAAALRWQDVDFDNGVLRIAHGKGDKERTVPLAGDYAVQALQEWKQLQPDNSIYVFCAVERGGAIGSTDTPITGTDVYRIWEATAKKVGIISKPHDARRTFITEALATGTPLATVQAIAGHAQGSTTLHYAQTVDARVARQLLKLRYG